MYTIEDLQRDCSRLDTSDAAIREDRGKRYGSPDDTLANVASFRWYAAAIALFECSCRVKNLLLAHIDGKDFNKEDVGNACADARNYARYVEILLNRSDRPSKLCAIVPPLSAIATKGEPSDKSCDCCRGQ